jgi:hypothetical protein
MAKSVNEFDYCLKDGVIKVSGNDGMQKESSMLRLVAPSTTQSERYATKIKQAFTRVIFAQMKEISTVKSETKEISEKGEKDELTGSHFLMLLFNSDIDVSDLITNSFNPLLLDVCFIDGVIPLKEHTLKQIGWNDRQELLGEYIKNFMAASLLPTKK